MSHHMLCRVWRQLLNVTIHVVENVEAITKCHLTCCVECGGKMHLSEGEYEKAHTDFFEAFKNYDESGSPRRATCLKYLVLANMLMKSGINPFDSQEAKPYKNNPEILAMTNLVR